MIALGFDPGLEETGWAVLEKTSSNNPRLVASGLIYTLASQPLAQRLTLIYDQASQVIKQASPDSIAIEEMFSLKQANAMRQTLQARGVILLAIAQAQKPFAEYNPRSVKLALTGSGSALKSQMQWAVQRALNLKKTLRPADVADAAAIALCHLRAGRMSRLSVLERLGNSTGSQKIRHATLAH